MVDSQGNLTASNAALNGAIISGGEIKLQDGASIIGNNGMLTTYIIYGNSFSTYGLGSTGFAPFGCDQNSAADTFERSISFFDF